MAHELRGPVLVSKLPMVACPAGAEVGQTPRGEGVLCRIEHSVLPVIGHTRSLVSYCCGDYTACPTWRAKRDAEIEDRAKVFQGAIDRSKGAVA